MAGELLRGKTHLPLYGKNGTLLYKGQISMFVGIYISWEGGKDVDICAFYSHFPGTTIGYNHGSAIDDGNGFTADWTSGDNTSGGPETVELRYSGNYGLSGKSFEIHANWYSVGTDTEGNEEGSGGPATITAVDASGVQKSYTIMPATRKHSAAQSNDPGVIIRFNNNGTIKEIAAI